MAREQFRTNSIGPSRLFKDGFKLIGAGISLTVSNICRKVDHIVNMYPWYSILVISIFVIVIAIFTSITLIGHARAERDKYNQQMVKLIRENDSLKSMIIKK